MIGQVWTPGETLVAGIGQGFVLATPVTAGIDDRPDLVNGGRAILPRLARVATVDGKVVDAANEPAPELGVSRRATLATLIEGMAQVTQHATRHGA